MYKCYYCLVNAENLSTAVNHYLEHHANHELVIGMLTHSTETGKLEYMAKHYEVAPSELHCQIPPKALHVNEGDELSIREYQSENTQRRREEL